VAALPSHAQDNYARDFRVADVAIANGCVESATGDRTSFGRKWCNQKISIPTCIRTASPSTTSSDMSPVLLDRFGRATSVEVITSLVRGSKQLLGPSGKHVNWTEGIIHSTGHPKNI